MYEYDFNMDALVGGAFGVFFAIYAIIILITLAVSAVFYVLQSLSLYTIANRRGIKNPWLAWVPVASGWTIGCISDQYRYVTKGEVKNKRKSILILNIVMIALEIAVWVYNIVTMIAFGGAVEENAAAAVGVMSFLFVIAGVATFAVSIAYAVIQYMALYDLYRSCEPNNATLYLVLSIVIGWLLPILMMICRKKDGGMPPRKADVAQIPAQPQEAPAPAEEPWQQPAEEAEPWNHPETEE